MAVRTENEARIEHKNYENILEKLFVKCPLWRWTWAWRHAYKILIGNPERKRGLALMKVQY
jgi:hypothetical protein